ncbi:MAG TPA: DNA polymerase III subunit delta [Pseudomonadales bacterium]|nr:DNA polymerase III subunit delta [Pseudomonadales bacterium]
MRIYPEKLNQHLEKTPAAVYWIAGDEPLLAQEACDVVRSAARQQGFSERKVFYPDKKDQWQEAIAEANALSLFADKCLIDIRTSVSKLDHTIVLDYLERPSQDSMILICTDKVESSSQKTQWFKAMEQACTFVPVMPLDNSRFPQWLTERARRKQVNLSADGIKLLADHTEGNLLAAVQELDKLALQFGTASISAEQVEASVGDSAHYEVFSINDALLAGDAATALKILGSLKLEGDNPLAILGALSREWRQLATAAEDMGKGMNAATAMRQVGVWDKRQSVFARALQRLSYRHTREIIRQMAAIDQAVKGMGKQDPWDLLQSLCLYICKPD